MWAELSDATNVKTPIQNVQNAIISMSYKSSNVVDARLKTSPKHTSDNETISRDDVAKIMQDAENAIKNERNLKFQARIYTVK